ncbi:MAG TPA: D-alanyl-D-alanine carboxypeptidase [Parafilimonas sp.]|nr:D-alanyl-D-alanine carboxypeptidase [Parafilimonas sp.]
MAKRYFFIYLLLLIGFGACSPGHKVTKAEHHFLQDTALRNAHAGISIYDAAKNRYVYNYQGDHYFTPASNTKLFTCYAAMKYLGDSIIGLRYYESPDTLYLLPTGDPTLLYYDFTINPVFDFLKSNPKPVSISDAYWKDKRWGEGWSWDDYMDDYMAERNPMPIYGNIAHTTFTYDSAAGITTSSFHFSQTPDITKGVSYTVNPDLKKPAVFRSTDVDSFSIAYPLNNINWQNDVPFTTHGINTAVHLLGNEGWVISHNPPALPLTAYKKLYSQSLDSMLKPMMHRSDNFYAEQTLLMVGNELLGYMNDAAIIDTLLKTDLKDMPQKPSWADGSGLSRFNLFTPEDIVTLLLKMKNEFGVERMHNILPKGNTGTLEGLYIKTGNDIFAKTGTLNGVVALSGYLKCKSGKLLLFSVLVNNHTGRASAVRRAIEKFITSIWEKY